MDAYFVTLLHVLAGFCAYAALQSLVTAAAGTSDRPLTEFAAVCLFSALSALFAANSLQAPSAAEYLRSIKNNLDALILAALCFSVFIARYAGHRSAIARVAFAAYATVGGAMLACNELRPYGLQYAQFAGIASWRLPWGEIVKFGLGRGGGASYLAFVAIDSALVYAFATLYRQYRRDRESTTLWLLVAVGAYLPLATLGALIRLEFFRGLEPGPFGLLIVVLAMGATLSRDTQRRLRASEDGFRLLFERSPAALVAIDARSGSIGRCPVRC